MACWQRTFLVLGCLPALLLQRPCLAEWNFTVTIDRGRDVGQSFGSLFEVSSSDGKLVYGAGFPNGYNTRLRADRHALQFFVRPADQARPLEMATLPRPNDLCGTYLAARDETLYSTYGGLKRWDETAQSWQAVTEVGGTQETMRVGEGILAFGDSLVRYNDRVILPPPSRGSYQLFFYANEWLCFYHVERGEKGYRPYQSDADGFSKLIACRWNPSQGSVDLSRAVVMTLPVVGETTFAWGVFGGQVVTGSNIGGFYILEGEAWRQLLAPNIGVSYQLYSSLAFHDRLLMGQYPTGRLFEYDGQKIVDLPGWPPVPPGVSGSAREAQTTTIYGGELFAGVWPWGELWRYQPDAKRWSLAQRMFSHPQPSAQVTHPYDVENRGHAVSNLWGQRVTSLVPSGDSLFVSTSAKSPCEWEPEQFPFLAPDKWRSYGTVYRLKMPGHLSANTRWTSGPTTFGLSIRGTEMTITQDGQLLAATKITGMLAEQLARPSDLKPVRWGDGIYGKFQGSRLDGKSSVGP